MEYKSEIIFRLDKFTKSENENDKTSAELIMDELKYNRSGANLLSRDLIKCKSKPEFFSRDYVDFIKKYDIRRLLNEGLNFGGQLTVVVDVDDIKSHHVQLCEGVSRDDFGGLNRNKNYQNIVILMHYPSDAKLIEYISQRFSDEFRNVKVVFSPR